MMTEKLFEADAYLRVFSATVRTCGAEKNGWRVTLDRTAFYPEGGGQPRSLWSAPADAGGTAAGAAM